MREFKGFKKGVNLGGWLSQCGEGNYTKERFDTFITEKDIEKIAALLKADSGISTDVSNGAASTI